MEYEIIFKKRFANNLLKVIAYLEQEWGKRVADDFMERITTAIAILKTHPQTGAP